MINKSLQPLSITQHWLDKANPVVSPNANQRPDPMDISLLVLHSISLPPGQFGGSHIRAFFQNRLDVKAHAYFAEIQDLRVSSHLLIDRQGGVFQFVPFDQRAWHAGTSVFAGRSNCNDFAIGIELEGTEQQPFSQAQYQQLAAVSHALMQQYPRITADRICAHSQIAPGRKADPGPYFDWRLYRELLALARC